MDICSGHTSMATVSLRLKTVYCIHKIPWKIWVDFQSYTNAVFLWPALYLMSLEYKVQTDVNLLSSTFLWSCILILWSVRSVFDFYFSNRKFLFVFSIKNYRQFQIQSTCFDFNAPCTCTKLAFFSLLATDVIF